MLKSKFSEATYQNQGRRFQHNWLTIGIRLFVKEIDLPNNLVQVDRSKDYP